MPVPSEVLANEQRSWLRREAAAWWSAFGAEALTERPIGTALFDLEQGRLLDGALARVFSIARVGDFESAGSYVIEPPQRFAIEQRVKPHRRSS